jgi:hypothetical protein
MKDIMRNELGAPKIVDRSTLQAELDALRVPAWGSTPPAARAAVDTFYFSALAPVRPTTSPPHTLRCHRTFGHLRRLLRHWLCSIRMRTPERLVGAPCRTEHRIENWAIPSLCRATPSATSERLVELLGSSPIFLSFVASCVSFQLRLLPSTGITFIGTSSLSVIPVGPACLSRVAS